MFLSGELWAVLFLLHIKPVCKAWFALSHDQHLPGNYDARADKRNLGFILHCDCLKQNKLYFLDCVDGPDQHSNKVRGIDTKLNSFSPEYQVVGSCNGLICVPNALYFNPMIVCNPLIGNFVELPKPNESLGREVAPGFGYHPTTKECKVVRLLYFVNIDHGSWLIKSNFQVFTLGTKTWRSLGSLPLSLDQNPSEALLNGALHWVTTRHKAACAPGPGLKIISFDIRLFGAMCRSDGSVEIWVMGEYNVKESWVKDYVIGAYLPITLNQTVRPPYSRPRKRCSSLGGSLMLFLAVSIFDELLRFAGFGNQSGDVLLFLELDDNDQHSYA
ncbi:F-box protein At3g07870-like [Herrania umbratica]|uniref:F-box protein At3g07870-like n=1 Tax=Herrania umbratica TaxID=108875 RepID=A0A6J0ZVJ1_9ROSI|nr:F-box protein At3g07870-like [Herrania umbratica]